jgi:hypothetical protein
MVEEKIDGFPRKAIRKLLSSPDTPEHLKLAWKKKLKKMKEVV